MEGPTVSAHISRIIVLGLGYLACKKHRDGVGIKVVLGASGGSRFYFDSSQQAMPTMTPFYPYLSLFSKNGSTNRLRLDLLAEEKGLEMQKFCIVFLSFPRVSFTLPFRPAGEE